MSERSDRPPYGIEYWAAESVRERADQRALMRRHILRTQVRFWLFVAALEVVFLLSLALEYFRAGGASISWWRVIGGMLPGLLGLAAVLGISTAFVRDVYEIPDWRTAFGYTWLLLFGRAPISALDPLFPDIYPYPFAIVQQGEVDEKYQNTLLVRFGGPGNVIVFNDSAVFIERFGRFTRVAGPGRIFLQRFERIHEALDLRPQERTQGANALTKDGIPVKTEVQIRFQLARPPASLVPPTPSVVYPVYEEALIRAGQCHLRSVNLDNGKESIARWPERASGVGGVMRALVAGYRLDELLEPYEPERDPHREISQRLHREVDAGARGFGAQVLEVRMGALEPTLEEVKEERVTSWQAAWKSKARTEAAAGMAEAIRERGLARAYAQKEIIMAIARELQKAAERGIALPAEFIALRFIEALRQCWTSPVDLTTSSSQALQTLDYLWRMAGQDHVMPMGGSAEPMSAANQAKTRTTGKRALTRLQIDRQLEEFGEPEQLELIESIADHTKTSKEEIRLIYIIPGTVLMTLEMPDNVALELMRLYVQRDPFISQFRIMTVEVRPVLPPTVDIPQLPSQSSRSEGSIDYELGLTRVRELLAEHPLEIRSMFHTLEARLLSYIKDERMFGPSEAVREGQARVVSTLNDIVARAGLGVSFVDFCRGQ